MSHGYFTVITILLMLITGAAVSIAINVQHMHEMLERLIQLTAQNRTYGD